MKYLGHNAISVEAKCIICGKVFWKRDKAYRGIAGHGIRSSKTKTCSHKCSNQYTATRHIRDKNGQIIMNKRSKRLARSKWLVEIR
jgi:hypothetical protein